MKSNQERVQVWNCLRKWSILMKLEHIAFLLLSLRETNQHDNATMMQQNDATRMQRLAGMQQRCSINKPRRKRKETSLKPNSLKEQSLQPNSLREQSSKLNLLKEQSLELNSSKEQSLELNSSKEQLLELNS